MYEISLVGVGISRFPSARWPTVFPFSRHGIETGFRSGKWLLAGAKIYYYFMIIIATNLMPLLVTDPGQRVVWFCLLQFWLQLSMQCSARVSLHGSIIFTRRIH